MQTTLTPEQFLQANRERREASQDYLVALQDVRFEIVGGENDSTERMVLQVPGTGYFEPTDHCGQQIARKLGIPGGYYRKMDNQAPELLRENVIYWRDNGPETDRKLMLRCYGAPFHTARAVLSDQYQRIDNELIINDVATAAVEAIPNATLLNSNLTDRFAHMTMLFPDLKIDISNGSEKADIVRAGIQMRNSEVGAGSATVSGFLYRDFCTNGLVFGRNHVSTVSKRHLGKRLIQSDVILASEETQKLDLEAFRSGVRDVVKAYSSVERLEEIRVSIIQARESEKVRNPEQAVKVLAKPLGLSEHEQSNVLENLCAEGDFSRWGMVNAVTAAANGMENSDRAVEIQTAGGDLLELGTSLASLWTKAAQATEKVKVAA